MSDMRLENLTPIENEIGDALAEAGWRHDAIDGLIHRLRAAPGGEPAAPEPPASDAMRERIVAVLTPFAFNGDQYSGMPDSHQAFASVGDLRAARALLAELTSVGGAVTTPARIMPPEPTQEMVEAFNRACDEHGHCLMRHAYRAMRAVAPQAEEVPASLPEANQKGGER